MDTYWVVSKLCHLYPSLSHSNPSPSFLCMLHDDFAIVLTVSWDDVSSWHQCHLWQCLSRAVCWKIDDELHEATIPVLVSSQRQAGANALTREWESKVPACAKCQLVESEVNRWRQEGILYCVLLCAVNSSYIRRWRFNRVAAGVWCMRSLGQLVFIGWLNKHGKVCKMFNDAQAQISLNHTCHSVALAYLVTNLTWWTTCCIAFIQFLHVQDALKFENAALQCYN